jgi:hypothetical protein
LIDFSDVPAPLLAIGEFERAFTTSGAKLNCNLMRDLDQQLNVAKHRFSYQWSPTLLIQLRLARFAL